MKIKSLAFIFALLLCTLCLFLSSCAKTQDGNEQNTQNETTETNYIDSIGCYFGTTLTTYSEYLSYIENHELGDDFITFDKLSAFGTFSGINIINIDSKKTPYYYMYYLNDSRDNLIGIIIQSDAADYHQELYKEYSKNDIAKNSFNYINRSDIRTLSEELSEYYVYDGFIYYYKSGNLCEIQFEFDGIMFTIHPNIRKNEEILLDPPLSKLLDLDTAREGRDEIIQLIKG